MAKKEKALTQYYRWQFLRLNEIYKFCYNRFYRDIKNVHPKNRRRFIEKEKRWFFDAFGIVGIYNYKIKKPPDRLKIYGNSDFPVIVDSLSGRPRILKMATQNIMGHYLVEYNFDTFRYAPKPVPKAVEVVINCAAEIGDIKSAIEKIVKPIQKQRKEILKSERARKSTNETKRDYDLYLKVYRLRKEKKLSNVTVAKKIFKIKDKSEYEIKNDYVVDIRPAEDKVNKAFQRAKNLIHNEYRNIIF